VGVFLTEAVESGGAQLKRIFHGATNKQQSLAEDSVNSCADQMIKLEQLHRKRRVLQNLLDAVEKHERGVEVPEPNPVCDAPLRLRS
jgi:hypothetical protein